MFNNIKYITCVSSAKIPASYHLCRAKYCLYPSVTSLSTKKKKQQMIKCENYTFEIKLSAADTETSTEVKQSMPTENLHSFKDQSLQLLQMEMLPTMTTFTF